MSDSQSIRTAIGSKLAAISAIQEVHDFHTMNFSGYPAATFELPIVSNDFITDKDNLRSYEFNIILHQEMEAGGRDNAIDILTALTDAIITAFDSDPTLGGVVKYCSPARTLWTQDIGGDGAVKQVEIIISCNDLAQVLTPV